MVGFPISLPVIRNHRQKDCPERKIGMGLKSLRIVGGAVVCRKSNLFFALSIFQSFQ